MTILIRNIFIVLGYLLICLVIFPENSLAEGNLDKKIRKLIIGPPPYPIIWENETGETYFTYETQDAPLGGYIYNPGVLKINPYHQFSKLTCDLKKYFPEAIIVTDQEGGVSRRFKDIPMLGAHQLGDMSYEDYYSHILEYSRVLKERCIDVNLAPVVNISRSSPVPYSHPRKIDEKRTYGDIDRVRHYSRAFVRATYDAGLVPTAKHFPGDVIIDKLAENSPYISVEKKYRREMNVVESDYPLEKNLDVFFFGKPQFIMWSSNIFPRYSDKPAFMVDEFARWLADTKCDCLVLSDALDEINLTDETLLKIFENSDMVLMYVPPALFVNGILTLIKDGKISEEQVDQKIKKIDKFKIRAGLS